MNALKNEIQTTNLKKNTTETNFEVGDQSEKVILANQL